MGFFGPAADRPDDQPAAPDLDQIVQDRLSVLSRSGQFSSTLSANEFALLTELGPAPVAQVMGASVHQVGWQYLPSEAQWSGSDLFCALTIVGQAWDGARRAAFARLLAEARQVGADAVVGVQLRRGQHDWARNCVDFVVNGTAIRTPRPDPANPPGATVLSDLSVQEYWKLASGGWAPAGLVAATSVFFVSQGTGTRWRRRRTVMQNQELHEFSDGFSAARHAVIDDLRGQAKSVDADGIVGVTLEYEIEQGTIRVQGVGRTPTGLGAGTISIGGGELVPVGGADKRSGVVLTVHAVGTAIRRERRTSQPAPEMMLSLGAVS